MINKPLQFLLSIVLLAATSANAAPEDFDRVFPSVYRDLIFDAKTAYEGKRYQEALPLFTKAACAGDKESQWTLGRMYLLGQGGERDDLRGYAWMKVAAEFPFATYQGTVAKIESSLTSVQRTIADTEAKAKIAAYGLRATNMSCNKSASRGGHIMDSITCMPRVDGSSLLLRRCTELAPAVVN
jgi:hypothetical protein